MQVVDKNISVSQLTEMSQKTFGRLVKAVVDIDKEIMAINGELHADEEALLLEQGSKQEHLWGINLYPNKFGDPNWIEFDSMINLRPSWGNRSRGVDDKKVQEKIQFIVYKLVTL